MAMCVVPFWQIACDFETNRTKNLELIELAVTQRAMVLLFLKISLTGFGQRLADSLDIQVDDHRLDFCQECSDSRNSIIDVGVPIVAGSHMYIGMVWFVLGEIRRLYAKQQLHLDEHPYFVADHEQVLLEREIFKLTPSICYEPLQIDHANDAVVLLSRMYLASVAKPFGGVAKAMKHYPIVAPRHNMCVVIANCVGLNDEFISVGQSAAWNIRGKLFAQFYVESERLVILDTHSGSANVKKLDNQAMCATSP